ncbi:MAG: hypothetical protein V3R25_03210 [Nitrosomonadaceae bacterium]
MFQRNRSFLRPLLLLVFLVVGPLQAQTVFACLTMDMVMNNLDNCKTNPDCVYMDFDDVLDLNQSPCFEQIIVLSINQDLQQNIPIINSVVESDVDPPQVMDITLDRAIPQQTVLAFVVYPRVNFSGQSGSNTYLITQRLRI